MILYTFNEKVSEQIMQGKFEIVEVEMNNDGDQLTITAANKEAKTRVKFKLNNFKIKDKEKNLDFEFDGATLANVAILTVNSAFGKQLFIARMVTILSKDKTTQLEITGGAA